MNLYTYSTTLPKVASLMLQKCGEDTFRRVGIARKDFLCKPAPDMVQEKVFHLI